MATIPETGFLSEAKRSLVERYLRDGAKRRTAAASPAIPRRDPQEPVPLSYEQEQIWLHAQLAPDIPLYNEPVTIVHHGPLDVGAFERSFNEILRRHEAWRSSIQVVDGRPLQFVHPEVTITLPMVDVRPVPEEQREVEAVRLATEDARSAIDLTKPPLFRARLVRLGDQEYRLYLALSHIIFDGVAIYRVFLSELAALYQAFSAGRPSPLPEPPIQYPDYACWQRRTVQAATLSKDIAYWQRQLADLPTLSLPVDRPRKAGLTFRGAMYPFGLSEKLTTALRQLSQREGVTLFQTLLAAFAVLLQRYSGRKDIPIGSATGGRRHPETQPLLGCFLNAVVLRLDVSGNPSFAEFLNRVRSVTIEALDHCSVPFGQLVQALEIERDASHSPLFQVMFTLEPPMPKLDSAWDLAQADVDTGATKYDLYFELDERPEEILARFHYSTDLFDAATIARMAEHWKALLEGAAADPGRGVSELPLLTEPEVLQLAGWNATKRAYPRCSIPELFEAQAEQSGDAVAVVFEDQQVIYRELNIRANQLARYLRKRGVGPEILTGLCVERSVEMVVGLLGILKAGGAYVPLDPSYPRERLGLVLSDAKPRVLLTQQSLQERLPETACDVVLLDGDWEAIALESGDDLGAGATTENLAYVIYTSGSTGKPKGVQIEHRSVVNFLHSMKGEPGLRREDVLLAVTTLSFDIAALEIFLPLICGARLVVAHPEVVRDGFRLGALIRDSGATVMQATPATWRLLIESGWKGSPKLKVLCGGEAMSPELRRELARRSPSVWNLYGPTETTIWSTVCRVGVEDDIEESVPIGRPIANTQVWVLDPDRNQMPVGVAGELYIGGDGLARGYLNQPEISAEKFVPNPFGHEPGERLYRTGDRARYLADGNIEFLGRTDHQVKIRGFRIELGEIEATLAQHPAVTDAVVAARDDPAGEKCLVAYVVASGRSERTEEELRQHLRQRLPAYMIPARFVYLDALPLTPNRKVNRKALPAPDPACHQETGAFLPARDELESRLVEIWETVLGVTPIGVRDDFFALGGHSLLAVRLFAVIEKVLGKRFPLATLFHAPTIEQLASVFRDQDRSRRWISLVPVQPLGSLPPLFCVHGHHGDVLFYRLLSQYLGAKQPFFALQARATVGLTPHRSIEAMACDYLEEVRIVQPHGPYFLAGYCFGARVALEMAHRLRAQGETVAFLGFFMDYYAAETFFARWRRRSRSHWEQLRTEGAKATLAGVCGKAAALAWSLLWRVQYRVAGHRLWPSSPLLWNVAEVNMQALKDYVPAAYPGGITVFLSRFEYLELPQNRAVDLYGMNADEIDVRRVRRARRSGSIFEEPSVRAVAEELRRVLSENARQKRWAASVVESTGSYPARRPADPALLLKT